ncbi:diguanylate cyclase [Thalassotalea fusca]
MTDDRVTGKSKPTATLTAEEIFSVFPDLIFVLDSNYIILEYRAGNVSDLYIPPQEFLGKSMCELLPDAPSNAIKSSILKVKQNQEMDITEYQLDINGEEKWFEARISQSTKDRFIMLVRDETQSKERQAHVQYQATHDNLTGLYNRAFALDYLAQQLKEASRQPKTLTVFFIDLDNFKEVNDLFGHEFGDDVLISIANTLQASVREQDLVSRIGGDEFIIGFSGSSTKEQLLEIADKLDIALNRLTTQLKLSFHLSISIGIASCDQGELTASELIRRADLAMYHKKRHGKHGATFYDDSMH